MNIVRGALVAIFFCTAVAAVYLLYPVFTVSTVNEPFPTVGVTATDETQILEQVRTSIQNTMIQKSGMFEGVNDHGARGVASVHTLPNNQNVLVFENFAVTNGPLLYVYLEVKQGDEVQRVELANLKGSEGNQNYVIPPEVAVEDVQTVLIYCKPFMVDFAQAKLAG